MNFSLRTFARRNSRPPHREERNTNASSSSEFTTISRTSPIPSDPYLIAINVHKVPPSYSIKHAFAIARLPKNSIDVVGTRKYTIIKNLLQPTRKKTSNSNPGRGSVLSQRFVLPRPRPTYSRFSQTKLPRSRDCPRARKQNLNCRLKQHRQRRFRSSGRAL